MKDFKGRKCSSRHFRRGKNLIPVLIPLEWKNDWQRLNRECRQSGTTDVPEDQYWKWREEQERSHSVVESIKSFTHSLTNRVKKLF
ncbi:hypothetical protein Q0590_29415 [Rhodocytophaga aerolata]|uniref:Transposase n=1 Tax=Rhodocytophaga aerolata TaxID=455078 RepID=A0ABT8RI11_9BACT|nr:hypothetical protein [Rhodocytophaga aerolata]MDO1450430.1 hypothetical protein [Rhodocytophaga aerolata]